MKRESYSSCPLLHHVQAEKRARRFPATLDLRGTIVSGDAVFASRKLSMKIAATPKETFSGW
jgi:hypothetical protein